MSDAVQIELIRAIAVIPGSIGGIIAAWFSYKSSQHSKEAMDVGKVVQFNTNGMSKDLQALTAKSSFAEGQLDQRNQDKRTREGQDEN